MRRVHTPAARRLVAQARTAAVSVRTQSSASSSSAPTPMIRIRSRGYGPSSDLLRGIPDHAGLSVEATLHPQDAEVQRAVLALSMPSLAVVHVTPVVPHDSYTSKVPQQSHTSADAAGGARVQDVLSPTEREVMEECLQEQLADVANLVVEQVGQRTGQQLDALQVTHADDMRNFAEIVLRSIQDELRQLRMARGTTSQKAESRGEVPDTPSSSPAAPLDVEAVAAVVSRRVMEYMEGMGFTAAAAAAGATASPATDTSTAASTEAAVARLERKTAALFEELQAQVQGVVSSSAASARATSEAVGELNAAVTAAVETASAAQQESVAKLVNDWLADMSHRDGNLVSGSSSGTTRVEAVGMRALEEAVESAVQTSTDELRRIITSEVKKLHKSKGTGSSSSSRGDEGVDTSELVMEVEKVFDLVQVTQGRLTAVDEVVGDVFKEQAATRATLQTIQDLLQKQLSNVDAAAASQTSASAATTIMEDNAATMKAVEAAVADLRREVAAAGALASVQQEDRQQQLLTVAQVVSDSVAAAVQLHTTEAMQNAMATVQGELEALKATANAAVVAAESAATAAAAAAAATSATPQKGEEAGAVPASSTPAAPSHEPLSKEVLADVVESVLSPRWAMLSAEAERVNTANQLAIEQQLLHMANTVAASVTASLQGQFAGAAAATDAATAKEDDEARRRAEVAEVAQSTATALSEKTTRELASLQAELTSTVQAEMRKSHEVDLTPMYKYIDSVLTFMKEELNLQETSLAAKMASLADTVTAAVNAAQERPSSSSSPSGVAADEADTATSEERESASASTPPASGANNTELAAKAAEEAASAPPPPITVELPQSLTSTLETQTGALRHLEERLNELGLTQSRDMAMLLTRLQEATADFRAATSTPPPPPSPLPLHAEQLAWQRDVTGQLTALDASLERRDAELLAAVRASNVGDDVKTHLAKFEAVLQSSSASQREELRAALRDAVSRSADDQSGRMEALMRRVDEVQNTLRDQAVAVQLLQPSLAFAGLTPKQQRTQARLRAETQAHLRQLTAIVEAAASQGGDLAEVAARATAELQRLRVLQQEEAALQRDAAGGGAGDAAATVESIVRNEVAKAQAAMRESVLGVTAHHDEAKKEVTRAMDQLLAKVRDVGDSAASIPSIADIQQVLDATLVRLATEQKEAGVHVTQLVAEATRTSAAEIQAVVQTTLSQGFSASVEQRVIPAYHEKVVASLQTRLAEQTDTVKAAIAGVADQTRTAVGRVEALVRDLDVQRAEEAKSILASHSSKPLQASNTPVQARMPLWWMVVNALLVCVVVLLSLYYVFVCLLLAFVPKPSKEEAAQTPSMDSDSSNSSSQVSAEKVAEIEVDSKLRRGSRYVDRYL